ncbi:hypothetical protein EMCRGX_G001240 [Ephydatia muelleri]
MRDSSLSLTAFRRVAEQAEITNSLSGIYWNPVEDPVYADHKTCGIQPERSTTLPYRMFGSGDVGDEGHRNPMTDQLILLF